MHIRNTAILVCIRLALIVFSSRWEHAYTYPYCCDAIAASTCKQFGSSSSVDLQVKTTPLHSAAETGSLDLIDTLLEHGAEIDAQDKVHPNSCTV